MIQSSGKLSAYGQEVVCVISALLTVLGDFIPWLVIPSLAISVAQYIYARRNRLAQKTIR